MLSWCNHKKDNFGSGSTAVDKQGVVGYLCTGLFFDKLKKEACRVHATASVFGGGEQQGFFK